MSITITLPSHISSREQLIVIRKAEYESLKKQVSEIKHVLKVIKAGEKEFKEGKIKSIKSSAELLK